MSGNFFEEPLTDKYVTNGYYHDFDFGGTNTLGESGQRIERLDYDEPLPLGKTSKYLMASEFSIQLRHEETEEYKALEAAISQGQPYTMDNGYTFVVDHRPDGHEFDYISAEEYTQYFADRQIPITAAGYLHSHDMNHARDYLKLFKVSSFADLVAGAAQNALPDKDSCARFTRAMDKFGDAVFLVTRFSYEDFSGFSMGSDIAMAKHNLRQLVSLYTGEPVELFPTLREDKTPSQSEELFDDLWTKLGLDLYSLRVPARRHLPLPLPVEFSTSRFGREEPLGDFRNTHIPEKRFTPGLPRYDEPEYYPVKYEL